MEPSKFTVSNLGLASLIRMYLLAQRKDHAAVSRLELLEPTRSGFSTVGGVSISHSDRLVIARVDDKIN